MQRSGPTDRHILMDAEARTDWGEKGLTLYEKTTIRPALSITGMSSGYQGPGVKNVIPSSASVKLNFRLVPNQRPEKLQFLFDKYTRLVLPGYAAIEVVYSSAANPVHLSLGNPYIKAAANEYESVFKQKTGFIRAGGTIAAVDFISTLLRIPVVLMGFAQTSDNMHAPNEKFYLPNFFRGMDTSIRFMRNVGRISPGKINDISRNATNSFPDAGY